MSTWSKALTVTLALAVIGAGCSIRLGTSVVKDGGVFRSDDHGRTWVQKNFVRQDKKQRIGIDDFTGRSLVFNPSKSENIYLGTLANGIWLTENAGELWQATSLRAGMYDCITFDYLNPAIMYTAAGTVVLKSTDAGRTWGVVYTESQPGQVVNCVVTDPSNGRYVWATTSGGKIVLSEDYGLRWTLMHTLPSMQPRMLYIPHDGSGQLFVFSRTNGIYRGDDRGRTWTDLSVPLQVTAGMADIRQVVVHPDGWYMATAAGAYKSTDRAGSWTAIPLLVTPGSVPIQNIAVNPKNNLDIYITTDQRLHHTLDGGATWAVTTLPTGRLPTLLTFDPQQPDRLYYATFKPPKK